MVVHLRLDCESSVWQWVNVFKHFEINSASLFPPGPVPSNPAFQLVSVAWSAMAIPTDEAILGVMKCKMM